MKLQEFKIGDKIRLRGWKPEDYWLIQGYGVKKVLVSFNGISDQLEDLDFWLFRDEFELLPKPRPRKKPSERLVELNGGNLFTSNRTQTDILVNLIIILLDELHSEGKL